MDHVNSFSPTSLLTALKGLLAGEPAVVVGAVATILVEAQQALQAGHPANWQAAVPILAGIVIRFFVTPASNPVVPAG